MYAQQADPSYTLWRWWRPQMIAKRRVRRRYYFDDGCHGTCAPYVIPGLCCVFLLLGLAFLIAGFATQFWIYYDEGTEGNADFKEIYFGLWTQCVKNGVSETQCEGIADNNIPDWLKACEGLGIVSLILLLLVLGFITYWLCSYTRNIYVKIFLVCAVFITFLLIVTATIVFRVKGEEYIDEQLTAQNAASTDFDFQWSFYLFAVSSAFVCIAGMFLLCIPAYGRHSEVYGDRVAITSRQPPLPVSTPPMSRPASMPVNTYPSQPRPMSIQGYGTRGYVAGGYSDSSGYPGLMRQGYSMPRGYNAY